MNTDRDKYLTEAMGITYGNTVAGTCDGCVRLDLCSGECPTIDFSTWQGFGKLWEWAQDQEWYGDFVIDGKDFEGCYIFFSIKSGSYLHAEDINPDRFANAVYEFLKGREA